MLLNMWFSFNTTKYATNAADASVVTTKTQKYVKAVSILALCPLRCVRYVLALKRNHLLQTTTSGAANLGSRVAAVIVAWWWSRRPWVWDGSPAKCRVDETCRTLDDVHHPRQQRSLDPRTQSSRAGESSRYPRVWRSSTRSRASRRPLLLLPSSAARWIAARWRWPACPEERRRATGTTAVRPPSPAPRNWTDIRRWGTSAGLFCLDCRHWSSTRPRSDGDTASSELYNIIASTSTINLTAKGCRATVTLCLNINVLEFMFIT